MNLTLFNYYSLLVIQRSLDYELNRLLDIVLNVELILILKGIVAEDGFEFLFSLEDGLFS